MRFLFVLLSVGLLAAGSYGCGKGSSKASVQTKKVGGCTIETTVIGTGQHLSAEAPADAAWIRVSSVESSDNELFKKAALDLSNALTNRGIEIYRRSELMHVTEGACWPPYSVELRIKLDEPASAHFYKYLLTMPIAGRRPGTERPPGYGPFFITCGSGSSDWWTVWYQ
jgi:hypothetical protein